MNPQLRDIVAEATRYGLLLTTDGAALHVRSVTGAPVPASLRDLLAIRHDALVDYLEYVGRAQEMLGAAMQELAGAYPPGCPTGSTEWREADARLTGAFWSGRLDMLAEGIEDYIHFAERAFADHTRSAAA